MQPQNSSESAISTPRGTVLIRPGQEEDAPAYRELRLEALRDYPAAFGSDYATSTAQPMNYWVERLRSSRGQMYFAVAESGDLVGMAGIYRGDSPKTRHSASLVSVYVRPTWRGLRITDSLIAAGIAWAGAQGVKIVKLAVVATNTAAIRCYGRCGFTVYGVEPQALCCAGKMYDELLMARALDSPA